MENASQRLRLRQADGHPVSTLLLRPQRAGGEQPAEIGKAQRARVLHEPRHDLVVRAEVGDDAVRVSEVVPIHEYLGAALSAVEAEELVGLLELVLLFLPDAAILGKALLRRQQPEIVVLARRSIFQNHDHVLDAPQPRPFRIEVVIGQIQAVRERERLVETQAEVLQTVERMHALVPVRLARRLLEIVGKDVEGPRPLPLFLPAVLAVDELLELNLLIPLGLDLLLLLLLLLALLLRFQLVRGGPFEQGELLHFVQHARRDLALIIGEDERIVLIDHVLQAHVERDRVRDGSFEAEIDRLGEKLQRVAVVQPACFRNRGRSLQSDGSLGRVFGGDTRFRVPVLDVLHDTSQDAAEAVLAVHVRYVLQAEHGPHRLLGTHRVDHQPAGDGLEHGSSGVHAQLLTGRAELTLHQLVHLRDDEDLDLLARADASHPVGPLHEVTEDHVLAERDHCRCVHDMLDVHTRGVDLVVEGEAPLEGNTALVCRDDAPGCPHQDLLLVVVV
mmetsp:Transcript_19367/g.73195  ORF Transcript_19367/g.73195 Transcript_19367/m.73195 type:complete len:503 (-) Transcript_19367:5005-6513(-)